MGLRLLITPALSVHVWLEDFDDIVVSRNIMFEVLNICVPGFYKAHICLGLHYEIRLEIHQVCFYSAVHF